MVSHAPGFVPSGADRKKETSSQRSLMEEIQEREEPPRIKDPSPSPSSPHPPLTPQTPERPAQSADSSKGHGPPKRFHFEICPLPLTSLPASTAVTSLSQWLLTPPPWTHSPPLLRPQLRHLICSGRGAPDGLNAPDPAVDRTGIEVNKQDCGSPGAGLSDLPADHGVS